MMVHMEKLVTINRKERNPAGELKSRAGQGQRLGVAGWPLKVQMAGCAIPLCSSGAQTPSAALGYSYLQKVTE